VDSIKPYRILMYLVFVCPMNQNGYNLSGVNLDLFYLLFDDI